MAPDDSRQGKNRNGVPHLKEHLLMARELVAETRANGGLAPVDIERFWADDRKAWKDPFSASIPQVTFGAFLNDLCIFDEMGVKEDYWRLETDEAWRLALRKAYNDKAEGIIGLRVLPEPGPRDPALKYPEAGKLSDVFEARNTWHVDSWWLERSANTPDELSRLLDRIDGLDIRSRILPAGWDEARARLLPKGIKPPPYRYQRGPVTFAMSVFGAENLIFLILEEEKLAARFRDTILRVMLEIARILDGEAGVTPEDSPRGFFFADDNCALLSPAMYEFFAFPILKAVYERFSPGTGDLRGQHSDSDMEHLLPLLGKLGQNDVNFGPTIPVSAIREHLPGAVIHGQLAPYTYMRNEQENIVLEFLRDFEMAREKRGLVFETAGSVNQGTRITSMRLAMAAIQRFGRY